MPNFYGGPFAIAAGLALAGDAHILCMGDSVHNEGRSYLPAHAHNLTQVFHHLRWNYMVAGGGYTALSQNYSYSGGYAGTGTTGTWYGEGLRTVVEASANGPKLIRPLRSTAFASGIAGGTDLSPTIDTGISIQRQFAASANATSNWRYPWPKHGTKARPWFHDVETGEAQYIKGKLIVAGRTVSMLETVDVYLRRNPLTSGTGSAGTTAMTTADFSTLIAEYLCSPWTDPIADAGTYHTTSGEQQNDHSLQLGIKTSGSYDEAGKTLDTVAAVFARCNSGGTLSTNARGAACGYDAFGRGGSYVTDWASNYATESDWANYFAYTVCNPTGVTVMFIELGRNILNVTEATSGTTNSGWTSAYQTFITKLKAAYATSFPNGTLHLVLVQPPLCLFADNGVYTVARCEAMQDKIQALCAANANTSWCSYFEYFNRIPPIEQLHPGDNMDGITLSRALRDMLDRATNFRYSLQGRVTGGGGSRSGRQARK